MVAAPLQAAAAVAYGDDFHVEEQRERYLRRLTLVRNALLSRGIECEEPEGTFYLWASREGLDGWALAEELAVAGGILVSPGEFYGDSAGEFIRVAVVAPDEALPGVVSRSSSAPLLWRFYVPVFGRDERRHLRRSTPRHRQ
jgi:aspartate/methionine/tyrosine aminotransferase